ncbi:MAG: M15 family metallopeptidase [Lachnospiraceae bacterium]|nr:M15 family metallopeptidase [Lachnospiraceae bacterium]
MKSKKKNSYRKYIQACWITSGFLMAVAAILLVTLAVTGRLQGGEAVPAGAESRTSAEEGAPTEPPTETPAPPTEPPAEPEILRLDEGTTELTLEWKSVGDVSYRLQYRCADGDEWYRLETEKTSARLTGLEAGTRYELRLQYIDGEQTREYAEPLTAQTKADGYGDPFLAVRANLTVGSETETKVITSEQGCFEMKVWPQKKQELFADSALTSAKGSVAAGTPLTVVKDEEGHYCYRKDAEHWSFYVTDADGSKLGWIDAGFLFVDLQDIFWTAKGEYGVQFDRTNAYSSIFKIGGSALYLDSTSDADSRYAPLKNKAEKNGAFSAVGRNSIERVTGTRLKNYGSRNQMPVIWALSLRLLQCQKNALANGCALLIYDGYRPKSASSSMNEIVASLGYLSKSVGGHNLANGSLGTNLTAANYIANVSKHNRGIAVDLTLRKYDSLDSLGDELIMQTMMHTLDFRSNMAYNNSNADLLYEIMTEGTGLIPLKGKQEWWHFELDKNTELFPLYEEYVPVDFEM